MKQNETRRRESKQTKTEGNGKKPNEINQNRIKNETKLNKRGQK